MVLLKKGEEKKSSNVDIEGTQLQSSASAPPQNYSQSTQAASHVENVQTMAAEDQQLLDSAVTPSDPLDKFFDTIKWFRSNPKYLGLIGLILLSPIIYWLFIIVKLSIDISSAEDSFAEGNYRESAHYYERIYKDTAERSDQLKLGKSYLFSEQYDKAKAIFTELESAWGGDDVSKTDIAELFTLFSIAEMMTGDGITANNKIMKAALRDRDYIPAHFFRSCLSHVLFQQSLAIGRSDDIYLKAKSIFSTIDEEEMTERELTVMSQGREACFSILYPLLNTVPLSTTLEQPGFSGKFGLSFPADAFDNQYGVYFNVSAPKNKRKKFGETVDLLEIYQMLMKGDNDKAKESFEKIAKSETLLYKQFEAFIKMVVDNNIKQASQLYKALSETYTSYSNFNVMYANSLVASAADVGYPLDETIPIYQEITEKAPENFVALNNLLHFYIYQEQLDEAANIVVKIKENKQALNEKLSINMALFDLLNNNLEAAEFTLLSFVDQGKEEQSNNLSFIYDALLYILLQKGEISEAITILKDNAKKLGETPEAKLQIADLFELRNQPFLVLEEVKSALEKFPTSKEIAARLALEYARRGNEKLFHLSLSSLPPGFAEENYLALIAKGIIEKKSPKANDYFNRAFDRADTVESKNQVLKFWARHNLEGKKLSESKLQEIVQLIQKTNPSGAPVEIDMLNTRIQLKNGGLSVDERKKLIDKVKLVARGKQLTSADTKVDMAWSFVIEQERQEAIDLANEVAGSLPNNNRRRLLLRGIDEVSDVADILTDDSEDSYKERDGLQLSRGLDKELDRRLSIATAANDLPQLIAIYTELIEENRMVNPALTYQNRGALYLKTKQFALAQRDFKTSLGLDTITTEQTAAILYNSSYALTKLKRFKEANESINRALDLTPNNVDFLLFKTHIDSNIPENIDKLAATFMKIIELDPTSARHYVNLSQIYRSLRDFKKAVNILNEGIEKIPSDISLYVSIRDIHVLWGKHEEAKEYDGIVKILLDAKKTN